MNNPQAALAPNVKRQDDCGPPKTADMALASTKRPKLHLPPPSDTATNTRTTSTAAPVISNNLCSARDATTTGPAKRTNVVKRRLTEEQEKRVQEFMETPGPRVEHEDAYPEAMHEPEDLGNLRNTGKTFNFDIEYQLQLLARTVPPPGALETLNGANWMSSEILWLWTTRVNGMLREARPTIAIPIVYATLFDDNDYAQIQDIISVGKTQRSSFPLATTLLVPVNTDNMHYRLLVVESTTATIQLWDSIRPRNGRWPERQLPQDRIVAWLQGFGLSYSWKFEIPKVPQQRRTHCGPFCIEFMRAFLDGVPLDQLEDHVNESSMPAARVRIGREVTERKIELVRRRTEKKGKKNRCSSPSNRAMAAHTTPNRCHATTQPISVARGREERGSSTVTSRPPANHQGTVACHTLTGK